MYIVLFVHVLGSRNSHICQAWPKLKAICPIKQIVVKDKTYIFTQIILMCFSIIIDNVNVRIHISWKFFKSSDVKTCFHIQVHSFKYYLHQCIFRMKFASFNIQYELWSNSLMYQTVYQMMKNERRIALICH